MGGSSIGERSGCSPGTLFSLALLAALCLGATALSPVPATPVFAAEGEGVSGEQKHVYLELANRTYHHVTDAGTVGEALREIGLDISADSGLAVSTARAVRDGEEIKLPGIREVRVEEVVTTQPPVEFRTTPRKTLSSTGGGIRLSESGIPGSHRKLFRYWMKGDELIASHMKEQVIREPKPAVALVPVAPSRHVPSVEEILERRTPPSQAPGPPRNYRRKLAMEATAYYNEQNAYINSVTATGRKMGYGIVAVDPEVIPLGSRLYVEDYGFAVAADTGGAIQGKIIDVAMKTREQAMEWGRKHGVDVYVID